MKQKTKPQPFYRKRMKKFDTIIVFKPNGFLYSDILKDYPLVFKCNEKDVDKLIDEFYIIAEKINENYKNALKKAEQGKQTSSYNFDKEFKKIIKKITNVDIIIPKKCYILD